MFLYAQGIGGQIRMFFLLESTCSAAYVFLHLALIIWFQWKSNAL